MNRTRNAKNERAEQLKRKQASIVRFSDAYRHRRRHIYGTASNRAFQRCEPHTQRMHTRMPVALHVRMSIRRPTRKRADKKSLGKPAPRTPVRMWPGGSLVVTWRACGAYVLEGLRCILAARVSCGYDPAGV